jgi:hypothetical protein
MQLRHRVGQLGVVALMLVAGVDAFIQVANEVREPEPGSVPLGALHVTAGALAFVAAVGVLRRARWAPAGVAAWGVASAALVLLLGPLGFVEASDMPGLSVGAAAILGVAGGMAWYVHRHLTQRAIDLRRWRELAPPAHATLASDPSLRQAVPDEISDRR